MAGAADKRRWAGAAVLAALFFALAAYHIDRPGLQADETLFAQGIFPNGNVELETRVFGARVPLMQMSYLGSLKSIVWKPVLSLFGSSAAAVRLPAVLAGAMTVALVFLLLWRLAGERAAWSGGTLLAVDPTFIFTTRCDWGPVALEHLLSVAGVTLFVSGRAPWGAFLFGLALWNKTTFLWTIAGLTAATAIWYFPQVRKVRLAAAALTLLAFAIGCYPWIRYNVKSHGGTAKQTARFDASDLNSKLMHLRISLEGSPLYGYMMRFGDARPWPRANFTPWLLMAAAVSVVLSRHRVGLFFLTTFGVAWLTMALTYGAGGSAHHVVLMWPWPHCVIGAAVAHWRRMPVAVGMGVLASLGVIMHHYLLIDRYGSDPPWSEAIYSLANRVIAEHPEGVFVNDWGMQEQLLLISRGSLKFDSSFDKKALDPLASRPRWIFASHVDAYQNFAGVNAKWKQVPGFRRIPIATIHDRQNKPVYELFRFERIAPAPAPVPPRRR